MIQVDFEFPVKEDAHKMFSKINNFIQGSDVSNKNFVEVKPVKKDPEKQCWYFIIYISTGKDDTIVEKYTKVSGGLLNLVNKGKDVWAFC